MRSALVVLCLAATVVATGLFLRTVARIVATVRLGQRAPGRFRDPVARTATLTREVLGHTRMARLPLVAAAHWAVMLSFGLLFLSLVTAYGQLVDPAFLLPVIGHFPPFEWATEAIAWAALVGILALVVVRQRHSPRREGRRSRFWGSSAWQAYYVEATILAVVVCVLLLRGLEYAVHPAYASALHFPLTFPIGAALSGLDRGTVESLITVVAAVKILVSMAWLVTIALQPTMGVAWHRFLAFPNIWAKRYPDRRTSLGPLQPILLDGRPVDFEELDEDARLGVGRIDDFTWKGLLDFDTCTECGRCQSQCPAWNTGKPLSPKLLVLQLRDHAAAAAPYLLAEAHPTYLASTGGAPLPAPVDLDAFPDHVRRAHDRPLVGATEGDPARPDGGAVIDDDVLWSCTTCGACVEQCPVDIEHVDHITDLRRYQVLIEDRFPKELGGLFRNLEKAGNPWGVNASQRMAWAADLPFPVPQVGGGRREDPESLAEVDYLFWVGCAGAFEDRAQRTTRAVAELLHTAGVSFAVLGDGESCTGDPARRAGNEFVFSMFAQQNAEALREAGATKVVVTCAHCFNTLGREYGQVGVELDVVHHTQLLDRLVREGRLTPVAAPHENGAAGLPVTYHDPCYLGRHNQVYDPPRDLIGATGLELREMPRQRERAFCCGAGGARMWMEERIGTRIGEARTVEALGTGAERIAIACPFCRIMLSDGLTAAQADGSAPETAEVVDVSQLLLDAVRRGHGGATTVG